MWPTYLEGREIDETRRIEFAKTSLDQQRSKEIKNSSANEMSSFVIDLVAARRSSSGRPPRCDTTQSHIHAVTHSRRAIDRVTCKGTDAAMSPMCAWGQADRVRLVCEDVIVAAAAGGLAATLPIV